MTATEAEIIDEFWRAAPQADAQLRDRVERATPARPAWVDPADVASLKRWIVSSRIASATALREAPGDPAIALAFAAEAARLIFLNEEIFL